MADLSQQDLDAAGAFADQVAAELERQGMTPSPEIHMAALELGLRLHTNSPDAEDLS
jgi:hypothetical protein